MQIPISKHQHPGSPQMSQSPTQLPNNPPKNSQFHSLLKTQQNRLQQQLQTQLGQMGAPQVDGTL